MAAGLCRNTLCILTADGRVTRSVEENGRGKSSKVTCSRKGERVGVYPEPTMTKELEEKDLKEKDKMLK